MVDKLDKLKDEVKKLSKSKLLDEYVYLYEAHDMLKYTHDILHKQFYEEGAKLKQQIEEKDKLLKCYQEEKLIADILGDKDLTIIGSRVHLKNLIVELKNKIKDRDIVIEEKDKEIETLKQELEEINAGYDFTYEQSSGAIKELKQNQTQLAIQELEKVKEWLEPKYFDYEQINYLTRIINNQIKELKGE